MIGKVGIEEGIMYLVMESDNGIWRGISINEGSFGYPWYDRVVKPIKYNKDDYAGLLHKLVIMHNKTGNYRVGKAILIIQTIVEDYGTDSN